MKPLRVLVADDEPLAREIVTDLLAGDEEVEVVATCGDGEEAARRIEELRPDIAFLDIEMPERGGLDVAAGLDESTLPACVFVTAFSEFAIQAFDVRALDYVVKPFSDRRFFAALESAKRRVRERRLSALAEQIAELAASTGGGGTAASEERPGRPPPPPLQRIAVRRGARRLLIPVEEIRWIESDDYYARLHTADGPLLLRKPLAELERELDGRSWLRVHRGALVNCAEVRELRERRGRSVVVLGDGTEVAVSRSRRKVVRERLLS